MTVPDGGGTPSALTQLEEGEGSHRWPSTVAGTSIVLFSVGVKSGSASHLAAIDRAAGRVVRFTVEGSNPRYASTGHIVYSSRDNTLRAVAFDARTMSISGNPVPVVEGVVTRPSGSSDFDIAPDGRLVYLPATGIASDRQLVWVDRAGAETPIAAPPRGYNYGFVSPDGTKLALDIRDTETSVWVWDLRQESMLRVSTVPDSQYGIWSADSRSVFISTPSDNGRALYRIRADATGEPERLADASAALGIPYPNAATPDGTQLVFRASGPSKNDLQAVSLADRAIQPVLVTPNDEMNGTVSPDGKWIAFESDLSGNKQIYARPFPDTSTSQVALSTAGGIKPRWSPTGREIFYVSTDNKLMAVPVDTAKGFAAGKPVALFDMRPYVTGSLGRNYDVSIDGKRFLMIKQPDRETQKTPIMVVIDWLEELKAKFKTP